jgi:choline dehydrogenase
MPSSHADTIIIGGGTAGAAMAGLLAENSARSVLLLEAGPDYGALSDGGWAKELLDARSLPPSHDWGYTSAARNGIANHPLERARVIGGCSSHNGCAAIWGSRADYDAWAALGNDGWSTNELLPFFQNANERLRVRVIPQNELTPFFEACLQTARNFGIPLTENLNDLDEHVAMGRSPVNIYQHIRWNTAFAYLDPVRSRENLKVMGNALVQRVRVENGRATSVEVVTANGLQTLEAGQVIVCAGAYESPAILMRSGIGDEHELRALGIEPLLNLRGVGKNLQDHPTLYLKYRGTRELIRAMQEFETRGGMIYSEQSIAKLRSAYCDSAFDLHLFPIGGPFPGAGGSSIAENDGWQFVLPIGNMTPRSRGSVKLASPEPNAKPLIDVGYLTDAEDRDVRILESGLEIARAYANTSPLRDLLGQELSETSVIRDVASIRANVMHYYHPIGTCKMGVDADAVVDARGRVQGIENLYVADASIMPIIPRANTNIPALVVAERIASWLVN